MYLSRAEKYDNDCAERRKADEGGILIYVHTDFLFISCEIQQREARSDRPVLCHVAFVIGGQNNLQRDPGTVDLLAKMSQQLAIFTSASQSSAGRFGHLGDSVVCLEVWFS